MSTATVTMIPADDVTVDSWIELDSKIYMLANVDYLEEDDSIVVLLLSSCGSRMTISRIKVVDKSELLRVLILAD